MGLRDRIPITFVTPEPYAGHLGIGGMANSAQLVTALMAKRKIEGLRTGRSPLLNSIKCTYWMGTPYPLLTQSCCRPFVAPAASGK
ncbi:hypothetical protein [Leptothermofonsia sp. ETS-13]|uniref:hypothetical protein n=1 Tax=Leptothermofonsia sp. ETS-13 TaxID=3035696 RepID=UPI003BA3A06F